MYRRVTIDAETSRSHTRSAHTPTRRAWAGVSDPRLGAVSQRGDPRRFEHTRRACAVRRLLGPAGVVHRCARAARVRLALLVLLHEPVRSVSRHARVRSRERSLRPRSDRRDRATPAHALSVALWHARPGASVRASPGTLRGRARLDTPRLGHRGRRIAITAGRIPRPITTDRLVRRADRRLCRVHDRVVQVKPVDCLVA